MKAKLGEYLIRAIMRGHPWPAALLLAFSLFVMAWQMVVRVPEETAYREHGVETTGRITELRKERFGLFRSATPGARKHTVVAEFTIQGGSTQRVEDEVSRRTFGGLSVGDAVSVRYVSDAPTKARLAIREYRATPRANFLLWQWIGGFAAIWLVVTLIFWSRKGAKSS
ncbi:MAG: DUF3592 domain-containing protein [Verrucomicrobiota bacterium]